MAGSWIKLSGTTGHNGAPLYALNMDYVTQVRFGDYYGHKATLTLIAGGENGKAETVKLSAADTALIRTWLDTHSYTVADRDANVWLGPTKQPPA